MLILAQKDTPYVHLSVEDCNFEIKGNSYSVLIDDIYQKISDWIKIKLPDADCEINWKFQFEMISSASLKGIIMIIEKLDTFLNSGKKIEITWISPGGDTDIIETGKDMSEITDIPFNFVERY